MNFSVHEDKIDMVRKWGIKADHDYFTARRMRFEKDQEVFTDTVCYHCHQTIEKYLKSVLVWNDIDFNRVHDLAYLQKLCATTDPAFTKFSLQEFSDYGTDLRYPDDFIMPTLAETDALLTLSEQVRSFVRNKLSLIFEPV